MTKRPWPLHPFLLSLLPLCITYVLYLGEYPPKEFLVTLGILLVATLLLLLAGILLLGGASKGSMLATVFLVCFFGYDSAVRFANRHLPGGLGASQHVYALVVCLLLLASTAWWLKRTRRDFGNPARILNVVLACALLIPVAQAVFYHLRIRGGAAAAYAAAATIPQATRRPPTPPDIYYIVLDRYGSQQTLAQYGCDNGQFLDELRRRGFYVATASRSNYLKTAPSLASSLNLEYLDAVGTAAGRDSIDWGPLFERIDNHAVARFLRSQGYTYILAGSLWWPTERSSHAQRNINLFALPSNLLLLGETTLLAPIADWMGIAALDIRRQQWRRIRYQFDELEQLPSQPAPKFVFAHLLVPHDPYIFDAGGSFVSRVELARRTEEQNYCLQVAYTNLRVLQLIGRLQTASPVPPVILLQGDEGPFPARYRGKEREFDWRKASPEEFREKVAILNAYFLPGAEPNFLLPSVSPVNSFRVVFNSYFGTNLPLLPDRTFAHENDRHPYAWFEVPPDKPAE